MLGVPLVVLLAGPTACGDDAAPMRDAGALEDAEIDAGARDDAETARPFEPTPPDVPWLPEGTPPVAPAVLTPCAPGWIARGDEDGPSWCDPFPASAPEACARPDQAHFPGESGCRTVGRVCAADDDWASDLPAEGVLYVRAREPEGGDGTRDRPFGTIRDAMRLATRGSVIALSKGRYPEAVALRPYVTLRGACAAETVLVPPSGVAVTVAGPSSELRDLRITGGDGAIDAREPDHEIALRGVILESSLGFGISVMGGASLVAEDVVVRGSQPTPTPTGFAVELERGIGIVAQRGATLELDRVVLDGARDNGLLLFDAETTATLRDVLVVATQRLPGKGTASAVAAVAGASLRAQRVAIERNEDRGIAVSETGSTVHVVDSIVRGTTTPRNEPVGQGLIAYLGGSLVVERTCIAENQGGGVVVADAAELALTDVVGIGPVADRPTGAFARGVIALMGARIDAERVDLAAFHGYSVAVDGLGTTVSMRDLEVRSTLPSLFENGHLGRAIDADEGATIQVERARLANSRDAAIVAREGAMLGLLDVAIDGVLGDSTEQTFGRGLEIESGAAATLSRVLVRNTRDVAVVVTEHESVLVADDLVIEHVDSRELDGTNGYGILAQNGGRVTLARTRLAGLRDAAVLSFGPGSVLSATDLEVRDIAVAACAETCARFGGGHGIVAGEGGLATIERFAVADAALCGLAVMSEAGLDARTGSVERSSVGACIQVEGYDAARLSEDVVYLDNGVNLDATSYPPPEALDGAFVE